MSPGVTVSDRPVRPLIVAHRAGNDLDALRAAERAHVDLVEADLWLDRGRIEVRHSKTMGPVPLLWDRWMLAPGWTPRFLLEDLVRASAPTTHFMLDLKGRAAALPERVIDTMATLAPGRAYTVSSQSWGLLDGFASVEGVRVVHSIGNERMLRAIPCWLRSREPGGLGINHRMLSPERATMLRDLAPVLFTWSVNDRARFDEVVAWGANGVISDDYAVVRPVTERSATG